MGEMPEGANALIRIDKTLHYCKHNCKWGFVSQGRPRVANPRPPGKVTKKKRIKKPKTLCITLEQEHYDYIHKMALVKTQQDGELVHPNDLIREALVKAFPCPEIYDLFGNRKKK